LTSPPNSASLPGDFKSPEEIYDYLCKLTYLLTANRISSRRAAILAYITSQVVRTGYVIYKLDAAEKAKPQQIIWDIARPRRTPEAETPIETPIEAPTMQGYRT
jgi:hypothetical protein